ncbi:MAG: chemotaxis protein CheX [Treponema sp.]|nr:chemotaxis protein CheX [Treponema sp.]MDY2924911.1 chemotaxis protein CheX [Treponema sp.]MDY5683693.1 chemotaxis protein CheX [Treponema sp.]
MDVKIINPFLTASAFVFKTMFGIEATSGAPYLMKRTIGGHSWEISGILGLTGEFDGIIALRLHKVLAKKMLERSGLYYKDEETREELESGMIAEVANVISGNAISAVKDFMLDIAPPVVIYGKDHTIAWPKGYPIIGIPYTTSLGPFEVDVCFKEHGF